MSTLTCEAGKNAPPVCLFRENSNGLVTLWEMIQAAVGELVRACNIFGQFCQTIKEGNRPAQQSFAIVQAEIGPVERACESLELDTCATQAKRARQQLEMYVANSHGVTLQQLDQCFSELSSRISDGLSSRFVFILSSGGARQYNDPLKGWETVADRWQDTIHDIKESSRCFALERYGAATFHVLQVAELGAIKLAELVGQSGDKPGWGCVDRLVCITERKHTERTDIENQHLPLLNSAAPYLKTIKDRWRHKLDHVANALVWRDTDFSPGTAEEIITATRGLMRGLAKDLP